MPVRLVDDRKPTPGYDTALSADEESAFQGWKQRYAPKDSGEDYDLRGAFKAGVTPDAASGHWPDTYKKPNHPTFSVESQYAKDAPDRAGRWEGETYIPPSRGVRLVDDRPGVRIVDDTPEQSESYLPTAVRVGVPLVAGIGLSMTGIGALPGAALIGASAAAAEAGAQKLEGREEINPYSVAAEGVLGAIPFGGKAASTIGRNVVKRGAQAAGFSLASDPVRAWAEGQPLWDPERALTNAAVGSVVGGTIGGGESALLKRFRGTASPEGVPASPETPPQAAPELPAATQSEPVLMPFDMQPPVAVEGPIGTVQPENLSPAPARVSGEEGAFDPLGIGSALLHPRQTLQQLRDNATAARAAQMGDIAARQGEQAPPAGPSINETFLEGRPAGNAPAYGVGLQAPGWGRDTSQLAPSAVDGLDSLEGLEGFQRELALKSRAEIDQARRGVVSHEQVDQAARVFAAGIQKDLGIDPTGVIESMRQNGEAVNAEGLKTIAYVATDIGRKLMVATAKAVQGGGNLEDDLEVMKLLSMYKGVLPQKAGALAEAGRALNTARQIIAEQGDNQRALEALVQGNGLTPDTLAELKRMALSIDPDDPKAVNAFWQEAANTPATGFEKFREYYLSLGLLSGIKSFFTVQVASQGLAAAVEAPVKGLSSKIDKYIRAPWAGTPQERFSGEATEYMMGLAKGIPNAAKQGFISFMSEVSDPKFRGSAGVEAEMKGAYKPAIGGTTGRIVRLPTRAIGGIDDFAMNITYDGQMATLLRREALRRGVPEDQVIDFADKAMRDMPNLIRSRRGQDAWAKGAHEEAIRFAKEVNFKGDDGPLTEWVKGIRDVPGWGKLSWVLAPFITTPSHLARAGGRTLMSPLTLGKLMYEGPARGGQWSDEVARASLGTAFVATVALDYIAGNITGGGPRDPNERDAKRRGEDWEPYSRKVNGKWVSYQRLDPGAITTGVIVDALEGFNTTDPVSAMTALSTLVANNVINKTYSAGLQAFSEAVSDPQRNGPKWAARVAGPILVPSIVNQIARSEDPSVRRPKTFGESMTQRLPGAVRSPIARMFEAAGNAAGYPFKIDTDLPPVRDVFGEPVEIYGTFLERMLNPFPRVPERTKDPAYKELIDVGYVPQGGRTTLGIRVKGLAGEIELTRPEVDMFETIGGRLAKRTVEQLIASPKYQQLEPEQKKFYIQKAFTKAHESAADVVASQIRGRALKEGRVRDLRKAGSPY